MSTKHMQQQDEEQKKHGDPLERALDKVAEHTIGGNKNIDPVPEPEKGNHAHSHAAHLGGHVNEQTKPAGNLRHGASPVPCENRRRKSAASGSSIAGNNSNALLNDKSEGAPRVFAFCPTASCSPCTIGPNLPADPLQPEHRDAD